MVSVTDDAIHALLVAFSVLGQVSQTPSPPVNPSGPTVDYYGIALDLASIAFFGIVAYILIRDRLRRGKATDEKTPQSNPGSST